MSVNPQDRRDELYARLMNEIKVRVQAISVNLDRIEADRSAPTAFADVESCFLQVRFICELVALAALLAHGGKAVNKLRKEWNAEAIFTTLEQIDPQCFPHPVMVEERTIKSPPGKFLNRSGLKKIYRECGRLLHRGSYEHSIDDFKKLYDVNEMERWLDHLKDLLVHHVVLILPQRKALVVDLFGGPNGEVVVTRMDFV